MYRLGRINRDRSTPFAIRPNLAISRYITAYENATRRNYVTVNPDPVEPPEEDVPSVPSGGAGDANVPTDANNVPPEIIDVPPEVIKVTNVDLDICTNTKKHHTDEFEIKDKNYEDDYRGFLIIRRGQKFNLKIEFNREYDKENDDLHLVFHFGEDPRPNKGTLADFILSHDDVPKEWGAYIQSEDSTSISLVVMTPPKCLVGKWRMNIDVVKRDDASTSVFRYVHKDPIYILFNPWCKDDQVYFGEEEEMLLNEYILKESGRIYCGTYNSISFNPWDFGQFTGNVLDCILYLLDISDLKDHARGNPVLVSRKLSAMVNNNDDDSGVLVGSWREDNLDGTPPLSWPGSAAILEEYYETKQGVRYAQCWVYSGVLTTACRALGIPARSITNFNSAHDTDGSISIDTYYDPNGKTIPYLNSDSVWNFHCWNDAWMARPDLGEGYGGWQAIDATPQETSDGVYQLGPVPLLAIKKGEVNTPYDGKFAFAEVNGDEVNWRIDEHGDKNVIDIKRSSIGRRISTKKPLTADDRLDITDLYKYPDGSMEEREAVKRANLLATGVFYDTEIKDVSFELSAEDDMFIGDTIKVTLKISNKSAEKRTIWGNLEISSVFYSGGTFKDLAQRDINATLTSFEETLINVEVPLNDYWKYLKAHCMCTITCMCTVQETMQTFTDSPKFRLLKPDLVITAPEKAIVGETVNVECSFVNPLPVALTKCELRVEGAHLLRPMTYPQTDVEANKKFTGNFEMTPKRPGERDLVVYFNCPLLLSVTGTHTFIIEKKP